MIDPKYRHSDERMSLQAIERMDLHTVKETYNQMNEVMYGQIAEQQCNQTFENVFRRVYVRTNVTTYEPLIVSMIKSINH
jgi:hypothetical protein